MAKWPRYELIIDDLTIDDVLRLQFLVKDDERMTYKLKDKILGLTEALWQEHRQRHRIHKRPEAGA